MSRVTKPQVVTANDLFEGDVVYFTADHGWARNLADAAIGYDQEAADALLTAAKQQQNKVVGPYLASVAVEDDGTIAPDHFREAFRTRGPSNYFHGKQAEA